MSCRPIVLLPGQGCQFYRMGEDLYRRHAVFRWHLDRASEVAFSWTGVHFKDFLYGPEARLRLPFSRTSISHPLVYSLHFALVKALLADGLEAAGWLGYSLGELTACALAEMIAFEDGVVLAARIGRWAEENTPPRGMMSVLGSLDLRFQHFPWFEEFDVACQNYEGHFVLTGNDAQLSKLRVFLASEGVICERLPIERGFHSSALDSIGFLITEFMRNIPLRAGKQPVYSCCIQKEIRLEHLRDEHVWRVHRDPVRYDLLIRALERDFSPVYLDASVTGTLAALLRKIVGRSQFHRIHAALNQFQGSNDCFRHLHGLVLPNKSRK